MQDELKHYGVIGMRWGVRHNPSRAFKKASKKANRLDKKSAKSLVKGSKKQLKSIKRKRAGKPYEKLERKASKKIYKSAKLKKKGMKWVKHMEKAFANVSPNDVSDQAKRAGRQYVYMLGVNLIDD